MSAAVVAPAAPETPLGQEKTAIELAAAAVKINDELLDLVLDACGADRAADPEDLAEVPDETVVETARGMKRAGVPIAVSGGSFPQRSTKTY